MAVPEFLDKFDNLYDIYELYEQSVPKERLGLEQAMLSDYLIASLPDLFHSKSFHLTIKQHFCGTSRNDKRWSTVMPIARKVYDNQLKLFMKKKCAEVDSTNQQGLIPAKHRP